MTTGINHWLTRSEWLLVIFEAAAVIVTIVEAIRRDPKDRILLFEFLAFATFFLGMILVKFSGFHWLAIVVWMILFLGFTLSAAYIAVVNWLRRIRRVG